MDGVTAAAAAVTDVIARAPVLDLAGLLAPFPALSTLRHLAVPEPPQLVVRHVHGFTAALCRRTAALMRRSADGGKVDDSGGGGGGGGVGGDGGGSSRGSGSSRGGDADVFVVAAAGCAVTVQAAGAGATQRVFTVRNR